MNRKTNQAFMLKCIREKYTSQIHILYFFKGSYRKYKNKTTRKMCLDFSQFFVFSPIKDLALLDVIDMLRFFIGILVFLDFFSLAISFWQVGYV